MHKYAKNAEIVPVLFPMELGNLFTARARRGIFPSGTEKRMSRTGFLRTETVPKRLTKGA